MDAKDILGFQGQQTSTTHRSASEIMKGDKSARKAKATKAKKPKKIPRELFNLIEEKSLHQEEGVPLVPSSEHQIPLLAVGAGGPTTKKTIVKWGFLPFTNSARQDGLQLKHWVRVNAQLPDYFFSKFNQPVDMVSYSEEEYEQAVVPMDQSLHERMQSGELEADWERKKASRGLGGYPSPSLPRIWTKADTDELFRLLLHYNMRFAVVHDRWESEAASSLKDLRLEDIKERYYAVSAAVLRWRMEQSTSNKIESPTAASVFSPSSLRGYSPKSVANETGPAEETARGETSSPSKDSQGNTPPTEEQVQPQAQSQKMEVETSEKDKGVGALQQVEKAEEAAAPGVAGGVEPSPQPMELLLSRKDPELAASKAAATTSSENRVMGGKRASCSETTQEALRKYNYDLLHERLRTNQLDYFWRRSTEEAIEERDLVLKARRIEQNSKLRRKEKKKIIKMLKTKEEIEAEHRKMVVAARAAPTDLKSDSAEASHGQTPELAARKERAAAPAATAAAGPISTSETPRHGTASSANATEGSLNTPEGPSTAAFLRSYLLHAGRLCALSNSEDVVVSRVLERLGFTVTDTGNTEGLLPTSKVLKEYEALIGTILDLLEMEKKLKDKRFEINALSAKLSEVMARRSVEQKTRSEERASKRARLLAHSSEEAVAMEESSESGLAAEQRAPEERSQAGTRSIDETSVPASKPTEQGSDPEHHAQEEQPHLAETELASERSEEGAEKVPTAESSERSAEPEGNETIEESTQSTRGVKRKH